MVCAIGEEDEGGGVGRPGEIGFTAGLIGRSRSDVLALAEVIERGNMDLAALEPCKTLAFRRDGNLADGKAAVEVGQNLVKAGGGGEGGSVGILRADRQEKRYAEKQRQSGTAKPAKRERHREIVAGRRRGTEGRREPTRLETNNFKNSGASESFGVD